MRLLIDTNLFLEVLLSRSHKEEVLQLFALTSDHSFYVSHFTVDSIGLYLVRGGQPQVFQQWVSDIAQSQSFQMVVLSLDQISLVPHFAQSLGLDYDDAYIYTAAEEYDLQIVSFDRHFDKTPRGRKEPEELI